MCRGWFSALFARLIDELGYVHGMMNGVPVPLPRLPASERDVLAYEVAARLGEHGDPQRPPGDAEGIEHVTG
jgi:hypothetical protein